MKLIGASLLAAGVLGLFIGTALGLIVVGAGLILWEVLKEA